jgi:TorA maturation chaperone TorD
MTVNTDFKTDIELEGRVFGYSFLFRSLMGEPSKDFLKKLKKDELLIFFPYLEDSSDIKKGIELVESYIQNSISDNSDNEEYLNKVVEELTAEYNTLFVGVGSPLAPPWESINLGAGRLFSLDETLDVRRHYAKYRLLPERLNKEPDDHIGFELQFMYALSEKTVQAMEKADYKKVTGLIIDQKDFLENHLLKWAPVFATKVCEHAESDFYRGVATMLSGFLKVDYSKVCKLCELLKIGKEQRS